MYCIRNKDMGVPISPIDSSFRGLTFDGWLVLLISARSAECLKNLFRGGNFRYIGRIVALSTSFAAVECNFSGITISVKPNQRCELNSYSFSVGLI